jgi:DNA-binding NarL/FixJ family response regulator
MKTKANAIGEALAQYLKPRELRAIAELGLTPRQRAVLERVHAGYADKQIADVLHMSRFTVRAHLVLIFHKLNVQSRVTAALVWERALHR